MRLTKLNLLAFLLVSAVLFFGPTDAMAETDAEKQERIAASKAEEGAIRPFADRVRRDGRTLHLKRNDGTNVILHDWSGYVYYTFRDYFKDIGYYIISAKDAEHPRPQYLMISGKTGRAWQVPAKPILSPDGRRIIVLSDETESSTSWIYIWRLGAEDHRMEFSKQMPLTLEFGDWISNVSARIFIMAPDVEGICKHGEQMGNPLILTFSNNSWHISADKPGGRQCRQTIINP